MADVASHHEHVAVADGREAIPLDGPAMNGHELAEDVVVADLNAGRFVPITPVLGLFPSTAP